MPATAGGERVRHAEDDLGGGVLPPARVAGKSHGDGRARCVLPRIDQRLREDALECDGEGSRGLLEFGQGDPLPDDADVCPTIPFACDEGVERGRVCQRRGIQAGSRVGIVRLLAE